MLKQTDCRFPDGLLPYHTSPWLKINGVSALLSTLLTLPFLLYVALPYVTAYLLEPMLGQALTYEVYNTVFTAAPLTGFRDEVLQPVAQLLHPSSANTSCWTGRMQASFQAAEGLLMVTTLLALYWWASFFLSAPQNQRSHNENHTAMISRFREIRASELLRSLFRLCSGNSLSRRASAQSER